MSELQLSQAQRQEILDGGFPDALTFPRSKGPKPLGGAVVQLERRVSVTIESAHLDEEGEHWVCAYRVRDDRPRLLRAGGPKGPEGQSAGQRHRHWRPDEEHGYTPNPGQALSDAGEAVDPRTQDRFTQEAELEQYQRNELALARRQRFDLHKRLERVREEADRRGVDVSSPERVIERQLEKMERRVFQHGKAA